jgi:hypothetical protein
MNPPTAAPGRANRKTCMSLKGWRRGSESNRRIKVLQTLKKLSLTFLFAT